MHAWCPVLFFVAAAAAALAAPACNRLPARADAGLLDAPPTPPECTGCPEDCCLVPDGGGYACMNWSRRNAATFECACGQGPACSSLSPCCPPANEPLPQMPPACVEGPSQCDPRATGR